MDTKHLGINSKLIHSGFKADASGSVNVPIYQTSTFAFRNAEHGAALFAGAEEGYIYTRIGNPTIRALEDAVAELENGCGGIATSSGMAAVCTAYLALLSAGDHVVSTASVYGPSRGLMEKDFSRFGVESSYVDTCDLRQVIGAMRPNTRLVYVETPANPTMQVTDIAAVAEIAHEHGCLVVVDNTFASPYLQQPLDLGADVVLHSVTKFINGHADVVGGILVAKDKDIYQRLRKTMVNSGCNMDPHQAFMVLRGLKTLGIRIERAQSNAMRDRALAGEAAGDQPSALYRAGVASAARVGCAADEGLRIDDQLRTQGRNGSRRTLMDHVHLATLAVSLGGVETLIEHPGIDDACQHVSGGPARARDSAMAWCATRLESRM